MDPLSIIASSLTLLGASISAAEVVVDFVSGIRNLDSELESTLQDVTEFRGVLVELVETVRLEELFLQSVSIHTDMLGGSRAIAGRIPAASTEAHTRITRTRDKLVEIETSVRRITSSAFGGKLQLLERKKLNTLRADLRDLKLSLSAQFSVKSGLEGSFLQGSILNEIQDYMRHTHSLEDEQRRIRLLVESLNARMQDQCLITFPTTPSSNQEITPLPISPQPQASTADNQSQLGVLTVTESNNSPDTALTVVEREPRRPSDPYYSSVFKLDINRYNKTACKEFCPCHCHRRRRRRTKQPFGQLSLGYSKLPFTRRPCIEGCTSPSPFSAIISYNFPAWFFFRVISLVFITSIFGDPWIGIKIRPMTAVFSIFRLCMKGDLDGLKKLLGRNDAHPSSSFWGGWTALHYAISNGNTEVCKFLLNEKADPYIEDGDNSLSALEWAWIKILGKSFPPAKTEEFKTIFTDRGCLEEMGFTDLHKLVLNIEHGEMATRLANLKPGEIDLPDFGGRTALSWAAQRGDLETVNLLLQAGADPNLATQSGMAPLHYASEAVNPDCIRPLLAYNANPLCVDQALHTALHFAARHHNDIAHIAPLINAGIPPDSRTDYNWTPLMDAVYKDFNTVARFLLDSGADVNGMGQGGKRPVISAVEYNAHLCLRLLLDRGADITLEMEDGQGGPTIAHMVARFADTETVRILNGAQLPFLALEALSLEDYEGKTLDERVRTREELEECGEDFREQFDLFLLKITDPAELVEHDPNMAEEFFDASETWDLD